MNNDVKDRCFLVGCARSGTTLLQTFLASHSTIASFPETHFFATLSPDSAMDSIIGRPGRNMSSRLNDFSKVLEDQAFEVNLPNILWPRYRLPRAFINCLDDLAAQMNCSIWLEKTPRHVFHIYLIKRAIPDAKFVHIIRDARDVVASLYQVTRQAEKEWGTPGGRSLEECTEQWVRSVRKSLQYEGSQQHHLVYFHDLVRNPKQCLFDICSFLEIDYEAEMMSRRTQQINKISTAEEFWKAGAGDSRIHRDRDNTKFHALFSEAQKKFVDDETEAMMTDVRAREAEIKAQRTVE